MIVGYAANAAVMGIKLTSLKLENEDELDLQGFLGLDPAVKPGYQEGALHDPDQIHGAA